MFIANGQEFLTHEETLSFLQVSKNTLYKMVKAGMLPQSKVAKKLYFKKSDVENLFFVGTKTVTKNGGEA